MWKNTLIENNLIDIEIIIKSDDSQFYHLRISIKSVNQSINDKTSNSLWKLMAVNEKERFGSRSALIYNFRAIQHSIISCREPVDNK